MILGHRRSVTAVRRERHRAVAMLGERTRGNTEGKDIHADFHRRCSPTVEKQLH
jgi:hypothetical protein